jgi:hypothetical protein
MVAMKAPRQTVAKNLFLPKLGRCGFRVVSYLDMLEDKAKKKRGQV